VVFVVFLLVRFSVEISEGGLNKIGLVNSKGGNCGT